MRLSGVKLNAVSAILRTNRSDSDLWLFQAQPSHEQRQEEPQNHQSDSIHKDSN